MSRSDAFWQYVCGAREYFLIMYGVLFVLLFLTGVGIALGTPGTQSYRLSFINLVLIGFALAMNTVVIWQCQRRT